MVYHTAQALLCDIIACRQWAVKPANARLKPDSISQMIPRKVLLCFPSSRVKYE